jgi:toxin YoeB
MYHLKFSHIADEDIRFWKQSGQILVLKKLNILLKELIEHPKTGTGKPEQLKGDINGVWSRRLNKKNRLIYSVNDEIVTVIVLSAKGHYEK